MALHENEKSVRLYEVGPRDGLQNEPVFVPTETKIALIDMLAQTGLTHIETASFVSPRWVPQMADGAAVMAGIAPHPGVTYAALVPNLHGMEAALAAGLREVAIFASASESFSQRNINCSIAESLARFAPVAALAKEAGIRLRGYVSCVTHCPWEGAVRPEAVLDVTGALLEMGCYEVSLGDTLGRAAPEDIARLMQVLVPRLGASLLAGHFHDTGGRALENVDAALSAGLRVFDSSVAGLGGCPYAPGAKGNVASLALAQHLEQAGWVTGLDLAALTRAGDFIRNHLRQEAAS